jgi:hypothetical protein
VTKRVFGKNYVGGHWIELVYKETENEKYEISHYCDLRIGYDIDRIYLSGTDYKQNYEFWYNLDIESASMDGNCLSYIYRTRTGTKIELGYGNLLFHGSDLNPNRFTSSFKGENNIQFRSEGFLISDKKDIDGLKTNFLETFKRLTADNMIGIAG